MSRMSNIKLGAMIADMQLRDAIHIAVAPVIAGERLSPGQHVGFIGEVVGPTKAPIGIVDPFLPGPVFKGDRFWLFLYPNTITDVRHDWQHPAFEGRADVASTAEAWLRQFAEKTGYGYAQIMETAKGYTEDQDTYIHGEGEAESARSKLYDAGDTFWDHYETVTGTRVPAEKRGNFFSCSC